MPSVPGAQTFAGGPISYFENIVDKIEPGPAQRFFLSSWFGGHALGFCKAPKGDLDCNRCSINDRCKGLNTAECRVGKHKCEQARCARVLYAPTQL